MTETPPDAPRGLRRAFRLAALVAVASCILMAVDAGVGLRLPAAMRPLLPWVLAVSTAVALALGVGAWGKPEAPDPPS